MRFTRRVVTASLLAMALSAPAFAQDKPTIPATMGEECAANPFLRADDPALAAAVGLPDAPPAEVFGEIRRRKDNFR